MPPTKAASGSSPFQGLAWWSRRGWSAHTFVEKIHRFRGPSQQHAVFIEHKHESLYRVVEATSFHRTTTLLDYLCTLHPSCCLEQPGASRHESHNRVSKVHGACRGDTWSQRNKGLHSRLVAAIQPGRWTTTKRFQGSLTRQEVISRAAFFNFEMFTRAPNDFAVHFESSLLFLRFFLAGSSLRASSTNTKSLSVVISASEPMLPMVCWVTASLT